MVFIFINNSGTLKGRVVEKIRHSVMAGKQDYSLPYVNAQMDFLNFMGAQQDKIGQHENLKKVSCVLNLFFVQHTQGGWCVAIN